MVRRPRYFEVVFKDFNVKLAVIEVLMYGREPKLPPWSLDDALRARGITGDIWLYADEHYPDQVVPDARLYFENLDLPTELLGGIRELIFDAACRVYFECSPDWEGETDQFDVATLDDLPLLPHLKRVLGANWLAPHLRDVLRSNGIEVIL